MPISHPEQPPEIAGADGGSPSVGRRSRIWVWGLTAAMLAAACVGATRLDWSAVAAALANTDPGWFVAAVASFMTLPLWMATEWRLIAARSPAAGGDMRTLLPLGCFTYFLQTYLNAALAYGTALLRLVRAHGWSIGQGAGLMTVDQVAEGISRLAYCGLVLGAAAGGSATYPWVAAGIGGIGGALVWQAAPHGKSWLRRSVSRRLSRLGHGATALDDVLSILNVRSFACGIALATAKKIAKISAVVAIERALGFENSLWTAVYFVAMLECATTLPLVPGHLGVIESTAAGAYAAQGFSLETGLSIGILYRAGIYLGTALMAAAAGVATAAKSRQISRAEGLATELPATPLLAGTMDATAAEVRPTAA